jgi:hypothetical protein
MAARNYEQVGRIRRCRDIPPASWRRTRVSPSLLLDHYLTPGRKKPLRDRKHHTLTFFDPEVQWLLQHQVLFRRSRST